nr:MAG TPA: hypothetical protein [Caudoviricetes sp.]
MLLSLRELPLKTTFIIGFITLLSSNSYQRNREFLPIYRISIVDFQEKLLGQHHYIQLQIYLHLQASHLLRILL